MRPLKLGEVKVRLIRVTQYFAPLGFAGGVLSALKLYGFSGWAFFALLPVFALVMWYDHKRALEDEYTYLNEKNIGHQELVEQVKKLTEAIDKLRGN
jgi:hypothetical protein